MTSLSGLTTSRLQRRQFLGAPLTPLLKNMLLSLERFLVMMLLLSGCFVLSALNTTSIGQSVRTRMTDYVVSAMAVMHQPLSWFQEHIQRYTDFLNEQSVSDVIRWQALSIQLQKENEELRQFLTLDSSDQGVMAEIIRGPEPYKMVFARYPSHAFVTKDAAVLDALGVIGRVVHVGQKIIHIALITDANSRTPIRFATTGEHAILAGTGSARLEILYYQGSAPHKIGDILLTSGHGGVYPMNIPVAIIVDIERTPDHDKIIAHPIANLQNNGFVRIINKIYDTP